MTRNLMRAEWLGSAGLTVLVRCVCRARLYLSRAHWSRRGFTVCDDCKAALLYASLVVIDASGVEEFVEMISTQTHERAALLGEVERELRRFVGVYDQQPEWLWSPATVKFVRAVRPKLELLGGAIPPARADEAASPEEAYRGG